MDQQTQAAPAAITAYKGFDADWKCRGFQYAVGQSYSMPGPVAACQRGFHACEDPGDVFAYYPPASSHFAQVEQSGELARRDEDSKVASTEIAIKAEKSFGDIIRAAIEYRFKRAKPVGEASPAFSADEWGQAVASDRLGAASATGYSGAASATGYSGAASATGYSGAASATGKRGVAMACGRGGRAMAADGCAIFLARRNHEDKITHVYAGIVGRDGVKPLTWYTLDQSGALVEV